ncbi:Hypothetical predicted protein [Octopus vulgaris]|uniref:Uncharacterized protein n=1 Tax=Octopus vulgaris TaxID=6645 RepID=A0AA36ASD0_OCTVU|nr:Hypothetical predicted protein [Octopus vulgaris]
METDKSLTCPKKEEVSSEKDVYDSNNGSSKSGDTGSDKSDKDSSNREGVKYSSSNGNINNGSNSSRDSNSGGGDRSNDSGVGGVSGGSGGGDDGSNSASSYNLTTTGCIKTSFAGAAASKELFTQSLEYKASKLGNAAKFLKIGGKWVGLKPPSEILANTARTLKYCGANLPGSSKLRETDLS